jgi:GMP synthase-like glutamine amidotransferase
MRALVLGNDGDNSPGFVGERAIERGFTLTSLVRERPAEWASLDGVDLVLSLGSEWSVYWDGVQPSVDAEIGLLTEARRRGIPILGLCFGSQVLARMLGAVVERAPVAEIGWHEVTPTAAGVGVIDSGPWFEWHYDRWELPAGAELLASNDKSNQAFRLDRILATQFHPELTIAMLTSWVDAHGGATELVRLGLDRDDMFARTVLETARTKPLAFDLFDCALEVVTAS